MTSTLSDDRLFPADPSVRAIAFGNDARHRLIVFTLDESPTRASWVPWRATIPP